MATEFAHFRGEQVAMDVQGDDGPMKTMEELAQTVREAKISSMKDGPTIVIPRVPERLRKGEEDAYEPYVVSIGPYHMGKPQLQAMQMHKCRFLLKILNRNPNVDLNHYILEITSLEKRARSYYPENMDLNQSDFVKMLLLDGCFLVELFLLGMEAADDQLFSVTWNASHLQFDLLLLENQIPFFILQLIFEHATKQDPSLLTGIAIDFCRSTSQQIPKPMPLPREVIHHLLHLYHMYILWSPDSDSNSASLSRRIRELISKFGSLLSSFISSFNIFVCSKKRSPSTPKLEKRVNTIPSATKLNEAGVKLKAKWLTQKNILDVEFSKDGVMEIPHLLIDYATNSLFRNLIAFEQLFPNSNLKFTAYVKFWNYIVNTPKDVALLHRNDIIEYAWGNEGEVVHLFNSLARDTSAYTTNYLHDVFEKVDLYCKTRRHTWRATLVHKYFSSPWSVFSLAAAVILLLLTFLQTFYAMYSYHHP